MTLAFLLAIKLFLFGFTLWFGAYLIARNSAKMTVRLTGLGILAFAIILAVEILSERFIPILVLLPALLWIGAALHLIPAEIPSRTLLIRLWALASAPVFLLALVNPSMAALVVGALLGCAGLIIWLARKAHFRNTFAVIAVVALFFGISTALMIFPVDFISSWLGMTLLGCDLLCLGLVITIWDAFDEGESLRLHLLRSFLPAFYHAGALALLAALTAPSGEQSDFNRRLLLTSLVSFGVLTQTFAGQIQKLLDLAAFPKANEMNRQREILYQTAEEMPRLAPLDPLTLSEDEFIRLTRRAISSLGNLPRLSVSPLMHLPQLRGISNPLERTQQLRNILAGQIEQLKPRQAIDFGMTDEWRYYNSLYFPYVAGLKPYARYPEKNHLDAVSRQALEWFQTSVPERTLHNWQNTASQLVAKSLRDSSP